MPTPARQRTEARHRTVGTVCGLILLAIGVALFIRNGDRMTLESTWLLLGILAVVGGGYLVVFGSDHDHPAMLRRVVPLFIPLVVLAMLFFVTLDTSGAIRFTVEDGPIENLQAMLLFVGAGLLVAAAVIARRGTPRSIIVLGILLAVGLFVVGMEEISWGQRIFDLDTADIMWQHNEQWENNLHNLHSTATEYVFYTLSFLIFVILPFFSDRILSGVERIARGRSRTGAVMRRFSVVRVLGLLLPSRWLVLPFAIVVAFPYGTENGAGTGLYLRPLYLSIITFTAVVVVRLLVDAFDRSTRRVLYVVVFSGLFLAAIYVNLHFQSETATATRQVTTEFRELLIAIGVVVYAVDTLWKVRTAARAEDRSEPPPTPG